MSTETSKLKPKADVIAQFRYSAEVQAIGVVEANGMVSLHGHDATHREKRLPLIASDQDLNPERGLLGKAICFQNPCRALNTGAISLLSEQTILKMTSPSFLRAIYGAFPLTWIYSSKSAKRAGELMLSEIAKFLGDFFDREVTGA